jgi:hypothetical protein
MSLALSFLGGMAKRGMQRNDERREIDNRIELETKLTDMRLKAQARKESAARNAARSKQKEESIAMFQALGGGSIDQATLNYVTGLPTEIQNSLLGKMQGPNAVDLGTLIKTQQITGKDGTETPSMSLDMEQFNKQYRQQQDTLSGEIESLLLSNSEEDHARAMTLIKRSHLINPPKKGTELSESDLRSHRNGFLNQYNMTENINGQIQLKMMEMDGTKEFNHLRDLSAAMQGESSYYNSVDAYAGQTNVQGWIESGERVIQEHVGRVVSKARDDNKIVQVQPNQYIVAGDNDATQANMQRIMAENNKSVVQFMEQIMVQGQRELTPKITIVIGDVANGELYKYTGM